MKIIGSVTEEEKRSLQALHEKKCALENLEKILDESTDRILYQQMLEEKQDAEQKYALWWVKMHEKYEWRNMENEEVYLDFDENTVCLSKQSKD